MKSAWCKRMDVQGQSSSFVSTRFQPSRCSFSQTILKSNFRWYRSSSMMGWRERERTAKGISQEHDQRLDQQHVHVVQHYNREPVHICIPNEVCECLAATSQLKLYQLLYSRYYYYRFVPPYPRFFPPYPRFFAAVSELFTCGVLSLFQTRNKRGLVASRTRLAENEINCPWDKKKEKVDKGSQSDEFYWRRRERAEVEWSKKQCPN